MEDTCFIVTAGPQGGTDYLERVRRCAAAHGGDVDGTVGGAILAVFGSPDGAIGCMEELNRSASRMVLHSAPLATRSEAMRSEAVVRAAMALAHVQPGAPVISTAFKARLSASQQARFPKQVLVEGWLPGWTIATSVNQMVPGTPATMLHSTPSRAPAPPTPTGLRASPHGDADPGVGETFVRAVRHALDQVDRGMTRSPDQTTLLASFANAGRPLTLGEVADLHHLTAGRTKELLKKATKKGFLELRPDDTYVLVSEESRLRRWAKKKRQKLQEHLTSYLIVNAGLFVINLVTSGLSPPWFLFPAIGWGVGLVLDRQRTLRELDEAVGPERALPPPRSRTAPPLELRPSFEAPPPPEPVLPAPWGEVERDANGLLEQLGNHLVPAQSSAVANPNEMLAGYRATVVQLATQGARIDGVLARFDRPRLAEELADAQERTELLERERDARLATTHMDRARLLEEQIRMIDGLSRQREASLLKLKNVITTLENLLLDLSRGALQADEDRVDSVLESGTRDLARYRDWLAEANAEIDRLLR